MMVVLANAYTGDLTSFFVKPKLKPLANSFEDLISRGMKAAVQEGSPLISSFLVMIVNPQSVRIVLNLFILLYICTRMLQTDRTKS